METRYLNTLVSVVETGTFSRAAELLHITQSAVSQRVKFLEEHFGCQLLDRSGQRLALTPAGRAVVAKAREILDKEAELLTCLQSSVASKRLSLGCTPTFGVAFLPQVMSDFLRRHTDLNDFKLLLMQTEEALRGLRDETIDLAVIEHPLDQDFTGFERYAMPDDEMLFVAAKEPDLPPAGSECSLEGLVGRRLFVRRDGCSSKELLRRGLSALKSDFDDFAGVVVSDDLRFTIQSVLAGDGVAYMSRDLVADHLADGTLFGAWVHGIEQRRGRSVVLLPQRGEAPLLGALVETIFRVVAPQRSPRRDAETATL